MSSHPYAVSLFFCPGLTRAPPGWGTSDTLLGLPSDRLNWYEQQLSDVLEMTDPTRDQVKASIAEVLATVQSTQHEIDQTVLQQLMTQKVPVRLSGPVATLPCAHSTYRACRRPLVAGPGARQDVGEAVGGTTPIFSQGGVHPN